LLRLWWLLIIAALVAGASTYFTVSRRAESYQAKTTLMIGQSIENPNPTSSDFYLAGQLASVYANIASRKPVRDATMAALQLDFLPMYTARGVPQTQFIEVIVTDTNPLRAQAVANELANQLIVRSPTGELSVDQSRRDFINQQIDGLQSQIISTQNEIVRLQAILGDLNSASEIRNTEDEISTLQEKLSALQGTYTGLLSNSQQGATNTLIVVEPADVPTKPIGTSKKLIVLLAAGIGLLLAAGAAYLLDYLDDTLKTPDEIKRVLGLPVIGYIAETKGTDDGKNGLYVSKEPRSPGRNIVSRQLQLMSEDQP
jgi:capsular polysaccharide biosynthesis protein